MAKKKELTCTFYIGGKQVDKLTPEQLDMIAKRMGEALSRYYTAHPEEYKQVRSLSDEEVKT